MHFGGIAGVEDGECLGVAGDGEDFGIGGVAANDLLVVVSVDLPGEDGVWGDYLHFFDNVGDTINSGLEAAGDFFSDAADAIGDNIGDILGSIFS